MVLNLKWVRIIVALLLSQADYCSESIVRIIMVTESDAFV